MDAESYEDFLLDQLRRVRERLDDPNLQQRRERDRYHEEVLVRLLAAISRAAPSTARQAAFDELDRLVLELARALPPPVSLPTRARVRRRWRNPLRPSSPSLPPDPGAWPDVQQPSQLTFDDMPEPGAPPPHPPDEPEAVRLLCRYLEMPGCEPQAAARARILLRLRDAFGRL